MIQPMPGPAGPPPRRETQPEPRKSSPDASFAGLLGATGSAGAAPGDASPAIEPQPAPGGPAFGAAPDAGNPAAGRTNEGAERFNEDGFFGKAVSDPAIIPAGAAPPGQGGLTGLLPVDAKMEAATAALREPVAVPLAGLHAGRVDPPSAQPRTGGMHAAQGASGGPARANAAPARSGLVEQTAGSGEVAETARPGLRLLRGVAARAAQSAARVAISETARGLDVAAFAGTLPAEAQDRLRDEIAALLSRHGLAPGRIHIAARRVPPASA